MASTRIEKRKHPRLPVILRIKRVATVLEPEQVDYATDLSEGGLFIRTAARARIGADLQLEFSPVPGSRVVAAQCRVVRVTDDGMAIEFTKLDSDSKFLLNLALSS